MTTTLTKHSILSGLQRRSATLFITFIILALLWPVWSVKIPALVDYPNHLARIYALANVDHDPNLQRHYQVRWSINPYLLPDLIFSKLAKVLDIYDTGRIYISAALLAMIAGIIALRRAIVGRIDPWTSVAFVGLYNFTFQMGFINFNLAIGLVLLAFAGWIASAHWNHPTRILTFSIAGLIIFLTQGYAFVLFGFVLAAYEFGKAQEATGNFYKQLWLRWNALILVAVPSLVAYVAWSQTNIPPNAHENISHKIFYYQDLIAQIGTPFIPLTTLPGPPTSLYFSSFAFTLLLLAFLCISRLRRCFTVPSCLRYPILGLLALSWITPFYLAGVTFINTRAPVLLLFITLASAIPRASSTAVTQRALILAALAITAVQLKAIATLWAEWDYRYAEFLSAAEQMPRGAKILPVEDRKHDEAEFHPLYWHVPTLAVISRSAYVPTMFKWYNIGASRTNSQIDTGAGNILARDLLESAADDATSASIDHKPTDGYYSRVYWGYWPHRYDFVYYTHEGKHENPLPSRLNPAVQGSYFTFFSITAP